MYTTFNVKVKKIKTVQYSTVQFLDQGVYSPQNIQKGPSPGVDWGESHAGDSQVMGHLEEAVQWQQCTAVTNRRDRCSKVQSSDGLCWGHF